MKIKTAVLGATGNVGQNFIAMLSTHPWFEIDALYASRDRDVYDSPWMSPLDIPDNINTMSVKKLDVKNIIDRGIKIAFSALPSKIAGEIESELQANGIAVFTNASPHRMSENVPIIIPEINSEHINIVPQGMAPLIANSNCTTSGLVLSLAPIADLGIERVMVSTYQSLSGAGYPGVPSLDIVNNILPFIKDEEIKIERETKKILGKSNGNSIIPHAMEVNAHTFRVAVTHGHMESVFVDLSQSPDINDIYSRFSEYRGDLIARELPSSPDKPIILHTNPMRPQPKLDVMAGRGMAISIGSVKLKNRTLSFKLLVNNVIRGAAGGSVQNAELAYKAGIIK